MSGKKQVRGMVHGRGEWLLSEMTGELVARKQTPDKNK